MSKVFDFTEKAVREYLRTVILIDDKAFDSDSRGGEGPSGSSTSVEIENQPESESSDIEDLSSIPAMGAKDSTEETEPPPPPAEPEREETTFNPQEVVGGFAAEGVVCGLYRPMPLQVPLTVESIELGKIVGLCEHCDVFILDWKFDSNDKESPVPILLRKLIEASEVASAPKAIRFCAIYTRQDPIGVFSELRDILDGMYPRALRSRDDQKLFLQIKGLSVVVYGKEPQTAGEHYVSSDKLASTIINAFTQCYLGILPALALKGVAAVRNNVNRILNQFPCDMDPAIVLHSGLTIKEREISTDVASLLGDEMASVLMDTKPDSDQIYDMCAEHVHECQDSVFAKTNDAKKDGAFSGHFSEANIRQYIEEVFKQRTPFPKDGRDHELIAFSKLKDSRGELRVRHNLLALLREFVERKTRESSRYAFGALSALFCQRTVYASQKIMRFGTVVCNVADDADRTRGCYLCLMPLCDSIRLDDAIMHRFPFWKLDVVDVADESLKAHGLYVKVGDRYSLLCAKGKIREQFSLFEFCSANHVVGFDSDNKIKTADGQLEFEWIAELKSAHIQRMAERISREFSRVGLTESEWLRLQVDR